MKTIEDVKAEWGMVPTENWTKETRSDFTIIYSNRLKKGDELTQEKIDQIIADYPNQHERASIVIKKSKATEYVELPDSIAEYLLKQHLLQAEMTQFKNKIEDAIREAEAFADKHELSFNLYPTYGMGGEYNGQTNEWEPSSQNC